MAEPLFSQLVLGLVPLPREVPPAPFATDDLQRLFGELNADANYQQFQFLPGGIGAQMFSAPDDMLVVQPGLLQLRRKIDSTSERVREVVIAILRAAEKRLQLGSYVQCGIKVVAYVPPPGMEDAKVFVSDQLMREGQTATQVLGPTFFGGGVKFTSGEQGCVEQLLIEPLLADNKLLFVAYDVQRGGAAFQGLDPVAGWIDDAFAFVRGPAMQILEG